MSVEKKVPEIRFKGFSGEWDAALLKDVSTYSNGGSFENDVKAEGKYELVTLKSVDMNGNLVSSGRYIDVEVPTLPKDTLVMILSEQSPGLLGMTARIPVSDKYVLNQRVAEIRPLNNIESYFLSMAINRNQRYFSERGAGTKVQNISKPNVENYEFLIPRKEEQTAIGNTFQKLDSLINQHKQKHDKLSNIKKAMLEKMFPKQGENIPEIRFKGFSGEWEEKEFGACFVNVPSNTLSRADLNYKTGLAKNIHYGDVLIKFGEILDARNELLPLITNDDIANKLKHAALRDGDIIIADAAEDSTVGKCTELFNIDDQLVLSGLHTIAVRPAVSFASKYLGYYLNSSSYHDQLLSLMQGTKVLSISKTTIQNTYVVFPNNTEEQTAIGNYFQKLDALINQHQQQIIKLNNIKQACLNKMFV